MGDFDFGAWFGQTSQKLIDAAIDYKVNFPQELSRLQIERLGEMGYYTEGQPGVITMAPGAIPGWMILGGAALVAVLLLKD